MTPQAPDCRARTRARWAGLALTLLVPGLLAPTCDGDGLVEVTVNAVPIEEAELLVVPPSGFTIDVRFPYPAAVLPETLLVVAVPWGQALPLSLSEDLVASRADGAVVLVSPERALTPGSYTLLAAVERAGGTFTFGGLSLAVREHPIGEPLPDWQWVQLDMGADRDADGAADLRSDLFAFGLASSSAPALVDTVYVTVMGQIVTRVRQFFYQENPSGLPGGDSIRVTFTGVPSSTGPFTRICVGGASPGPAGVVGNVLFDAGNGSASDVACNDFIPTGVFPRELLFFAGQPAFQAVFAPLLSQPVGSDPLDALVLSFGYDPADPAQRARRERIDAAIAAFAQAVATVTAHETCHALGLVPPGDPGGGLFGGVQGVDFSHNLDTSGARPSQSFLMNLGASFSFAALAGLDGVPLPRLRALNFAYLRGRLVLDASVQGIYRPPRVEAVAPDWIELDGPVIVLVEVSGLDFIATPSVRLLGPNIHALLGEQLLPGGEVAGWALLPQLAEGVYDVEVRNPDGQVALLPAALTVE